MNDQPSPNGKRNLWSVRESVLALLATFGVFHILSAFLEDFGYQFGRANGLLLLSLVGLVAFASLFANWRARK